MFLIVGLGNYGRTYVNTRHNAGFDVLEILSRRWGIPMDRHGRKALYGEGSALGARVVLAQPQTYMNLSGDAVVALAQWYHVAPQNVIVVYDDVDLPIGRIRMRSGGSAGTHNGMRDIQLKWGKEDFPRVRVGIGRPLPGRDIKDHVLTRVSPEELPAYQESLDRAADAVAAILEKGMIWAQDHFNGSPKPEKPRRERGDARAGGVAKTGGGAKVNGDSKMDGGDVKVNEDAKAYRGDAKVNSGDANVNGDAMADGAEKVSSAAGTSSQNGIRGTDIPSTPEVSGEALPTQTDPGLNQKLVEMEPTSDPTPLKSESAPGTPRVDQGSDPSTSHADQGSAPYTPRADHTSPPRTQTDPISNPDSPKTDLGLSLITAAPFPETHRVADSATPASAPPIPSTPEHAKGADERHG